MATAPHGGRRTGAGRPPAYREPLVRATVTLPASYAEQLRRFGGDNLSEGIRRLVEEARTPSGHAWYILPEWAKDPEAVYPAVSEGHGRADPSSKAGAPTPLS